MPPQYSRKTKPAWLIQPVAYVILAGLGARLPSNSLDRDRKAVYPKHDRTAVNFIRDRKAVNFIRDRKAVNSPPHAT